MSDKKLRAGVIGCGLGSAHAYAYAHAPDFELVSVCDLSPEVLETFWERSRLERGSVKQYRDYREMLEKEALDVVSVATPDDHHTEPVCDASNAGARAVFCEKPICISLKDADRMIETVERNGTKMSVDHTRSFVPFVQEVRRQIRDGAIGGLTRIVQHMGGRRSMLFRNGTHAVDLVCFFADADPVWVIAAHEQGFEDYGPDYKGEGGKDPRLDPGSTVIIEFANGVRGILNSAKMTPQLSEIDLQGPSGRYLISDAAISDAAGVRFWKTEEPEGRLTEALAPQVEGRSEFLGDRLILAVQELAQMVWNDAPSSSPPQRARNTLEILTGALVSQSRGSTKVHLPQPRE